MQITHEEARRYIQFDVDHALTSEKKSLLSAHLNACLECSAYAEELRNVEQVLLPVMKRHWEVHPAPLPMSTLLSNKKPDKQAHILLTMRTALISVIFMAFVFSAWQFAISGIPTPTHAPAGVLPVPTPSIQSTSTRVNSEHCEVMMYTVKTADTLASIALQFAVSTEDLMAANQMKSATVNPSTRIMIPVCGFTPTSTAVDSTLFTTTFTPLTSPAVSTPGG